MKRTHEDAFTGLEAAIVLIAFIVIAAVFANVVLGAGFFTTQKSQETVYKGIEQASSNIQMIGQVYGLATDVSAGINEIKFSIILAPGSPSSDLTKMQVVFSTPSSTSGPVTLTRGDTASTTTFTTKENGRDVVSSLSDGQQVELDFMVAAVPKSTTMTIEVRPAVGASLPFSKTTPATISGTNMLY